MDHFISFHLGDFIDIKRKRVGQFTFKSRRHLGKFSLDSFLCSLSSPYFLRPNFTIDGSYDFPKPNYCAMTTPLMTTQLRMMIQALVNFIRLQDALYTIVVRFFTVLGVASAGDNKRLVDDVYNYMFTSGRGYNSTECLRC